VEETNLGEQAAMGGGTLFAGQVADKQAFYYHEGVLQDTNFAFSIKCVAVFTAFY
jgi:hypothetical protein